MTPSPPFFVIRNSIHDIADNVVGSDSADVSKHNDEDSISHYEQQTHVSIVRLIEAPGRGMYKLDFCSEAEHLSIEGFIEGSNEARTTYIDESSWRHLHTFATLIGKASALSCHPIEVESFCLPGLDPCLALLKENVVEVLREVLPLETLFSWNVLVDARKRGDLKWKDIRAFLSAVRENVPFLTKEGILKSNEVVRLSFVQFVAFSKIVESHLNILARTLPLVSCKVLGTTTSTAAIQLESSHDCIVRIGAVAADSSPPTTADLQNHGSMFTSWNTVKLGAGASTKIKVDSLAPNSTFRLYLRVEKCTLNEGRLAAVASSDADVCRSQVDVVTDCQTSTDIFPGFSSMTPEEQKTEILAVVNDHTVRQEAPVIPDSKDELVSISECSSDWNIFIQWWTNNQAARSKFLLRELSFAASDKEISRQAERDGISMNDRKSKKTQVREMWSKLFAAWYFGKDVSAPRRIDAKEVSTTALISADIQNYQFETVENKVTDASHNMPGFLYRVWRSSSVILEEEAVLHGDESRPSTCNPEHEAAETPSAEQTEELDMDMHITSVQPKTLTPKSRAPPLINEAALLNKQPKKQRSKKEVTNSVVSDNHGGGYLGIGSGVVGEKIMSRRRMFLDRVTKKVHAARTKAEELTGSDRKLRGIELFRAKVRLVMLLCRIAQPGANSTEFNVESTHISAKFDLFEFDESMYNFDSLAPKQKKPPKVAKAPSFDPNAAKELRHRNDLKLAKRAFDFLLNWKNDQISERNEMQANASKAEVAYRMSLARRTFRTFQDRSAELKMERGAAYRYKSSLLKRSFSMLRDLVMQLKMERLAQQQIPDPQVKVIESDLAIKRTHSFEMKQLSYEDELSSKFRENRRFRFGIDPSPFAVKFEPRDSRINNVSRADYEEFFAYGIEMRSTQTILDSKGKHLMLLDQDTLRCLKQEKLKASSNSGVNIFDVPADVLMNSCRVESNQIDTEYRMREKVECLAGLEIDKCRKIIDHDMLD